MFSSHVSQVPGTVGRVPVWMVGRQNSVWKGMKKSTSRYDVIWDSARSLKLF